MKRLVLAIVACMGVTCAHADPRTDCPSATSCKILTLTADEERALVGQNMVFDTASQGRTLDLLGAVLYFRNKIATAPAGDVAKSAEPASK